MADMTHAGCISGNATSPTTAAVAITSGVLTFQRNSTSKAINPIRLVSQSPIAMRPKRTLAPTMVPIARPGQRLTHRDHFAHLLLIEPGALGDQLTLHLADQRHRAAKPKQPQTKEIRYEVADGAEIVDDGIHGGTALMT
jgi:hypothetical protein